MPGGPAGADAMRQRRGRSCGASEAAWQRGCGRRRCRCRGRRRRRAACAAAGGARDGSGRGRSAGDRQVDVAAHRQPAVGAEVVLAAVDRGAAGAGGDAGLAQDRHRLALCQGGLERAQLGVDVAERAQLGEHQRVVALAEAVQVEDQPAEDRGRRARAPCAGSARRRTRPRALKPGGPGCPPRRPAGWRPAPLAPAWPGARRIRRGGCRCRGRCLIHGRPMLPRALQRRAPCRGDALGHRPRREAHGARAAVHAMPPMSAAPAPADGA